MIQLSQNVKHIHAEGGFEMRNWISNSKGVLNALNSNLSQSNKCISDPDSQYEKVLGLWWLPESDEFTFIHKFKDEIFEKSTYPTKRQLLRILMTIFDPLGLLGFLIVEAKIILQDVWRSGTSWDEPIHDNERKAWWQWIQKLKNINKIKIPRCFALVSQSDRNELHIFVDASTQAYAALAYIKASVGDDTCCSLIASKTRVAPLKPISVPRMELMSAILGLRLAKFIQTEISVVIKRRYFWTDSKDVLYWIRSDARKFQQFVAVRIGEILENSAVDEWRWVSTSDNVADDGTKFDNNPHIHENLRWFAGPKFLYLPEDSWPKSHFSNHIKEIFNHMEVSLEIQNWQISPGILTFSTWERLRRSQMYILQFLRVLTKQSVQNLQLYKVLNTSAIKSAEMVLIRHCQHEAFHEEISQLNSPNGFVNRKSLIYKFSPYIDEYGILRVKGRIDEAVNIPFDAKRPIILPRNNTITHLIADFYHRRFHHHHNEIVVNEMRQRFCIRGMRALVREIARNCQHCRNRRATPAPPEMGNLPQDRLAAFTRPFTFTGVDYFGPLEVVVGRRREKRWGVLFTCMTIRAIHIEICSSLSTDSFLLVLKQFISRRGVPHRIYSDNATNFRGASRILIEETQKISYDDVERKHPEIEWLFIPPASPHMGGAWERMIRSVKSILFDILPQERINEEILRATLADIENIINMRPLTYIPLESNESEALTPNHFLLGSSSGIREKADRECSGTTLAKNFRVAGKLADTFWKRWVRECLPCLTRRAKWFQNSTRPISVNDIVIIVDDNSKRNTWAKGRVIDVIRAKDGEVRSAVIKTLTGISTRPVVKLARLELKDVNTTT
ncbi:uncharacterized protein LOC135949062 [Calliphora vicina]|uniref:uncharacterized protein LOC135949062 n=1 Tax=Calliphora vicina TaxID=7373 RepID=UPI00325BCF08